MLTDSKVRIDSLVNFKQYECFINKKHCFLGYSEILRSIYFKHLINIETEIFKNLNENLMETVCHIIAEMK